MEKRQQYIRPYEYSVSFIKKTEIKLSNSFLNQLIIIL